MLSSRTASLLENDVLEALKSDGNSLSAEAGAPVLTAEQQAELAGRAATGKGVGVISYIPEPPLVSLLRRLMQELRVVMYRIGGRCHLGSGGAAHVFAVADADADATSPSSSSPRALRVVLSAAGDYTFLAAEFAQLKRAAGAGAPVVPPVDGSLHEFSGLGEDGSVAGGGFLLQHVGKRFEITSLAHCCAAFDSLAALHRRGIIHGDARLPNLLNVQEAAVWIDLHDTSLLLSTAAKQRKDAAALARSVLSVQLWEALPADVAAAIRAYNPAAEPSVRAVAVAVWG